MKNFQLQSTGKLSTQLIQKGFSDFESVAEWVKQLPYQRISDKSNLALTITEHRGTCSTKHAFLKAILVEQGVEDVSLHIGIFKMNEQNTPPIREILQNHHLEYIPEAHCYLKFQNQRFDYTMPTLDLEKIEAVLMEEIEIQPADIGDFKVNYHKNYISNWLEIKKSTKNLEEIWEAREACIARLSQV